MATTNSKIRVLLVQTSFVRTSGGGVSFLSGLQEALLSDSRLEVTRVLPAGGTDGADLNSSRPSIRVRPLTGLARILRDVIFCQAWARRSGADIVLVPHEYSPPVRRANVVNVIQNILYLHPEGRRLHPVKGALMRAIMRVTHRFASRTICVSPESAALWRQFTGSDPLVLPQGISQSFRAAGDHEPWERLITIFTGSEPHKHPEIASELATAARRKWPEWNVRVIGLNEEDPESPAEFVGRDQLAQELRRSYVVVLTSTVESFGLPAFEARASGAHVVVHPGTAMADWLADDEYTHVAAGVGASPLLDALGSVLTAPEKARPTREFHWRKVGSTWSDAMVELSP